MLSIESIDRARVILFKKCKSLESLPPTFNALQLHIRRSHLTSMSYFKAKDINPKLPQPTSMGWKYEDGRLIPELMTLEPVPDSWLEIISCGCKSGCSTRRCKCRKSNLHCTGSCKCQELVNDCLNVPEN